MRSVTKHLTSARCNDAFLLYQLRFERAKMNCPESELIVKLLLPDTTIRHAFTRLGQGYFSTRQTFIQNFSAPRLHVLAHSLYLNYNLPTRNIFKRQNTVYLSFQKAFNTRTADDTILAPLMISIFFILAVTEYWKYININNSNIIQKNIKITSLTQKKIGNYQIGTFDNSRKILFTVLVNPLNLFKKKNFS